jgi:dynein heavy chain
VLYVTGTSRQQKRDKLRDGAVFGPNGPYECPCYKYPKRTDRFFIFTVDMASKEVEGRVKSSSHWTLRGVALLCSID